MASGTYRLLKEGKAILVASARDIIENYNFLEYKEIKETIHFEDELQEKIYILLKELPQTSEQISRKLKQEIENISVALTILEMQDIIEKMPGGSFRIKR